MFAAEFKDVTLSKMERTKTLPSLNYYPASHLTLKSGTHI